MLNRYLQYPWKHRRYCCLTWWKDGGYNFGVWLCIVLGLTLLLCCVMFSWIGSGRFHCRDLSGGFCGAVVYNWDWQVAFGIVLAAFGCWQPLVVGKYRLLLFPHLYLLYFSYIFLYLVYSMIILNLIMHTTATPDGWGEDHTKWLHNYKLSSYPLIIQKN